MGMSAIDICRFLGMSCGTFSVSIGSLSKAVSVGRLFSVNIFLILHAALTVILSRALNVSPRNAVFTRVKRSRQKFNHCK